MMTDYCFHVVPKHDRDADSYWVLATSEREARRLVSSNVAGSERAIDEQAFLCVPSPKQIGSRKLIYRRLGGPITIAKR
jgi:hypothetical protein